MRLLDIIRLIKSDALVEITFLYDDKTTELIMREQANIIHRSISNQTRYLRLKYDVKVVSMRAVYDVIVIHVSRIDSEVSI